MTDMRGIDLVRPEVADSTRMFVGFAVTETSKNEAIPFILFHDPVFNEWIGYGLGTTFNMDILKHVPMDMIRQYHPYQLPLLTGFRKNIIAIGSYIGAMSAVGIIVQMLRDSGYTVLPDKEVKDITSRMLDAEMRKRPDLYQRKEMKEDAM